MLSLLIFEENVRPRRSAGPTPMAIGAFGARAHRVGLRRRHTAGRLLPGTGSIAQLIERIGTRWTKKTPHPRPHPGGGKGLVRGEGIFFPVRLGSSIGDTVNTADPERNLHPREKTRTDGRSRSIALM
jgi:hypothetical protein